jgi:hypothetical protein
MNVQYWEGAELFSGGSSVSCFLKSSRVYCWGIGNDGRLGDRSTADNNTPNAVYGLVSVTDFDVSGTHGCAVNSGRVYCWGERTNSRHLGDGRTVGSSSSPIATNLTNATKVSTGAGINCAVRNGGEVWCWGGDTKVPLGYGGNNNETAPIAVRTAAGNNAPLLSNATDVSSGSYHACAVTSDGFLYCWGNNSQHAIGMAGDDDMVRFATKVQHLVAGRLTDLTDVVEVAVGDKHTCVTRNVGSLYVFCWGSDSHGQLGDENRSPFLSEPTAVAPMYDDRVFVRLIELDSESYYARQFVTVTGFGLDPRMDAQIEIRRIGQNWQSIQDYQIPGDGRVNTTAQLDENLAAGLYLLRLHIDDTRISNSVPFTVLSEDDHSNVPAGATLFADLPGTANGTLTAGDLDWFGYTATGDGALIFTTTGSTDTVCETYVDQRRIDVDDDSGSGTNCQLSGNAEAGTVYRFKVRHFSSNGTGDYAVSLTAP